jgi:hypothetical protein
MRLSAPTKIVFILSLILFIVSIVAHFVQIPYATQYQYWILVAAYVVLGIGVLFKGF